MLLKESHCNRQTECLISLEMGISDVFRPGSLQNMKFQPLPTDQVFAGCFRNSSTKNDNSSLKMTVHVHDPAMYESKR